LHLPPLRERRDDIEELSEHFLQEISAGDADRRARLSAAALAELKRRPWWGNVRELRNALEHAATLARGGMIAPEHLPPAAEMTWLRRDTPAADLAKLDALIARWAAARLASAESEGALHEELLALVEPPLFQEALRQHHGQVAAAARALGLHRTTLKKKMDQYGIETD
jgi:two-component system nitrogen regulation response regulator GlnG